MQMGPHQCLEQRRKHLISGTIEDFRQKQEFTMVIVHSINAD
jgi:hypothetical protein